jgi:hypothetical protein
VNDLNVSRIRCHDERHDVMKIERLAFAHRLLASGQMLPTATGSSAARFL